MKTTIKINDKDVEITLTPSQVAEIKKFEMKITDRVKTFEDACKIVGVSNNLIILLSYNGIDKDMIAAQAHAKIGIIAKALNEGWFPDFGNSNEAKYYPWMKYTPGSGFSFHDCDRGYACSCVGSRLCYKNRELAEYAAKQFQSIYNDLLS